MNIDKLLDLITKKEIELQSRLNEENDELNFFEKVTTENCFSNVESLLSIDKTDVLTAYLSVTSKELPYYEIKELVKELCDLGVYDTYLLILSRIVENYNDPDIIEKIPSFLLKSLLEKDRKRLINNIKILSDNNDDDDLATIFTILEVLNDMEESYEHSKKMVGLFDITMTDKRMNSIIYNEMQDVFKIKSIMNELSKISSHYQKLNSEEKNRKKFIKNKLNDYSELKIILNNIKIKGISNINIEKVISLIADEEIKKEFLYQLNIVQNEVFNDLYKEYCKLSNDNKLEIHIIFEKYNYDFNSLSFVTKDKVIDMNKNDLDLLLLKISQLNIDNKDLDFILQNSNYNILEYIENNIKEGILTYEFVINNLSILSIKEDGKYNNFIEISEFIKKYNINPRLFINDQSIYLSDVTNIENNIIILNMYNLLSNLKSTNNFDFIKDNDLINKIDMLLELGYEKELENNIGLLNNDKNDIKKLYILKEMGLLPTDIESLIMVLNNDGFIINSADVDNYIFNIVDYRIDKTKLNNLESSLVENTVLSSRVITINNVILSRNRVIRNQEIFKNSDLDETDKLIYSYIYGSILTEEEYDSIVNYVKGEVKIK